MIIEMRWLRKELKALISDEQGSYLALIAFILTGVLGFAGMGVDVAMWYQEKRTTQNIADAAAVAATHVKQRGGDLTAMTDAALTEATRNGFVAGPDNQVIVDTATGGAVGGATPVVNVQVRRAVPLFLLTLFRNQPQVIAAAASGGTRSQGNYCVIGLDHPAPNNTTSRNVEFIGTTTATIPCGVHSDSTTADSLYIGGNATLMKTPASAAGGIVIAGNAQVISQITMQPSFGFVGDPLASKVATVFPDRTAIASIPCAPGGSHVISSDTILSPNYSLNGGGDDSYKICGDLTVKPGETLTLNEGTYFVEDGDILIQGILDATAGVTIVLTGTSPGNVGTIDIRAQAIVNWWAPSADGPYKGIAFIQDPDADTIGDNKFNGGANLDVRGYIYLKNQKLTFNGGVENTGCTYIIARQIEFSGNSDTFVNIEQTACTAVGIDVAPEQYQVVLVN